MMNKMKGTMRNENGELKKIANLNNTKYYTILGLFCSVVAVIAAVDIYFGFFSFYPVFG
mgnify:CR=1 FL=1